MMMLQLGGLFIHFRTVLCQKGSQSSDYETWFDLCISYNMIHIKWLKNSKITCYGEVQFANVFKT